MEQDVVKLTVNLLPEDVENLDTISKILRVPRTEALRRALSTETYLVEQAARGAKTYVENADGRTSRVIVAPQLESESFYKS